MTQVSEHYSFAFRLELINKVAGARWCQSSTKTYTIHEQTVIIKEKTLQFDWSFSQERQIFKEPVCRGFILKSLSLSAFIRAE